ncbi:hypothetical protein BOX15_Mlig022866g4, partial [Macrostomum lignano]
TDPECYIRGCVAPVSGTGARIPHPLCERHLEQDKQRVQEFHKSVLNKLKTFLAHRNVLRLQQQALAAELEESEELFESVLALLTKWKTVILDRLTTKHNSVLQKLSKFSILQQFKSAVTEAENNNDVRKVFDLTAAMDLESSDLEEQIELDNNNQNCAQRIVGDISGSLRDLQLSISRQMSYTMQLCEPGGMPSKETSICEFQCKIANLEGSPTHVTSCSNTKGFTADTLNRVIKADPAADDIVVPIPEPCIFVAFHSTSKVDHFSACSIDGSIRLKVYSNIDWSKPIVGLCCDSKRQALFVAQSDSVRMTDLSGKAMRFVDSSNFGQQCQLIGMTCNTDKIFALQQCEQSKQVFCIDKGSGRVQSVISIKGISHYGTHIESMAVLDNALLLTDWNAKLLHKVCIASGHVIVSYPSKETALKTIADPSGVAAHRSGLIFVSERSKHMVRVLRNDGFLLQSLGTISIFGPINEPMNKPCRLTIVDGKPDLLLVSQRIGNSISVYRIRIDCE